jgi:hypothetical protein
MKYSVAGIIFVLIIGAFVGVIGTELVFKFLSAVIPIVAFVIVALGAIFGISVAFKNTVHVFKNLDKLR